MEGADRHEHRVRPVPHIEASIWMWLFTTGTMLLAAIFNGAAVPLALYSSCSASAWLCDVFCCSMYIWSRAVPLTLVRLAIIVDCIGLSIGGAALTPAFIAAEARQRSGSRLASTLDTHARARDLAGAALGLSLDAQATVWEMAGLLAKLPR